MVAGLFASHDASAALDEYIGSKVCRNCHTDHFNGWAKTAHNQIRSGGNSEASYINDGSGSGRPDFFDGVEYDLRDLPGGDAFLPFGNDAPVIGANANGPYGKIGGAIYDVQWALGGSAVQSAAVADTDLNGVHNAEAQWRQLFLAKVAASRYLLPFQLNAKTAGTSPTTPRTGTTPTARLCQSPARRSRTPSPTSGAAQAVTPRVWTLRSWLRANGP